MNEIYPSEQPEQESALLIVDEIDAHLHPEWQQALVGLIKELFPKLQIIATTHSPLIVAGLKASEVFVAMREPDHQTAAITHAPIEFEGMRADQLLTSPLFGLVTTRGSEATSAIQRYSFLIGKSPRSKKEDAELAELRQKLEHSLRREKPFLNAR